MKLIQSLIAMAALSSVFLIVLYSTHLQVTSSHQTLQEDVQKNPRLYRNDVDVPHTDAPHADAPHVDVPHADAPHTDAPHAKAPHVDASPVDIGNVSVSNSFSKAIPKNGAYWNRLLHSTLRQLNEENENMLIRSRTSGPHCRELRQELLQTNIHDFGSYSQQHQDFSRGMECRHPPILIDQPDKCRSSEDEEGDGHTFLLLAIKSNPGNFERRQAVRETWGREGVYKGGLRVRRVFLLGSLSLDDPDLKEVLSFEAKHFGDLLQWDFHDTLFNLTLKEHAFYSWSLARCPQVSFVFKGDDDVFANMEAILVYLQSLESSKAAKIYAGQVIRTASPHRDPKIKYYIPMTFYDGPYPAYAGGGGYLFSGALLRPLYYISLIIPFFPIDDVYSGMCFLALGIPPEAVGGFYTFDILAKDRDNMCVHKELLLVHQRSPQQVKKLWRGIHSPFLRC